MYARTHTEEIMRLLRVILWIAAILLIILGVFQLPSKFGGQLLVTGVILVVLIVFISGLRRRL
jgi:hypothetical protein